MSHSSTSRRIFLASLGVAGIGLVGGCLSDSDEATLPAGFASDGIDHEVALGPDSPMETVDRLSLERTHKRDAADWVDATITSYANQELDTYFHQVHRITHDHQLFQDQYFDQGDLLFRFASSAEEPGDFDLSQSEYNSEVAHELRLLRQHVPNISWELDESADGQFHFVATDDDLTASHIEAEADVEFGSFEEGRADLVVDEDGYIHQFAVDVLFEEMDGTIKQYQETLEYAEYTTANVPEPEWLDRAEQELNLT